MKGKGRKELFNEKTTERNKNDTEREEYSKQRAGWRNSCPSAAVFSAGFSTEKSASELPVKQNHYTVNPRSIFI